MAVSSAILQVFIKGGDFVEGLLLGVSRHVGEDEVEGFLVDFSHLVC